MDPKLKQAIKRSQTFQELKSHLRTIPYSTISVRDIEIIYRALNKTAITADLRIAYLGNHTIDSLSRYTSVACALEGYRLSDYIGNFNQYFQEVLASDSGLIRFDPNIIFLTLSMRELSPSIHSSFCTLTAEQRHQELERIITHILDWVTAAKERTEATILVTNFPRPPYAQGSIADSQMDFGEAQFYSELNLRLITTFKTDPRAYVVDLELTLSRYGLLNAHSPKMYYLAKMEWAEECLPHIAADLKRYIRAIKGNSRKCLVLDLDNTLWGGVVGEDGVTGIRIGPGDSEGEAFREFQQVIHSLKGRGILLAICSKNNPEDVMEVFETRKDMVLRMEDFSEVRINWEHKHKNLQEIARALSIGTDSMVFVDDSPLECELIRQMMPEVKTIQLTGDPAEYAGILRRLDEFEKLVLTAEDRVKSEQYRQNVRRKDYRQEIGDISDFLEGLGTKISIASATEYDLPRVHQLFSKTNQFNLTTKRYSLSEIEAFIKDDIWDIRIMDVTDNFGALGIVGLCLIERIQDRALIHSYILSCRAMGRGVETAMMNQIKCDYMINGSFSRLEAKYIPTTKNKPVMNLYEEQGFSLIKESGNGVKCYELTRDQAQLLTCPGITVQVNGNYNE